MEIQFTSNPIVNEVGKMHFSGNIVPEIWFHTITDVKKTTLALVVLILGEIVYWYRPSEVRDEAGQFIAYKQKFHDKDYLQMSYEQLAQKYHISKGQAKAAIVALEDIGVIKRHFRTVVSKTGMKNNNVLYIELIPSVLQKLTDIIKGIFNNAQNCVLDKPYCSLKSFISIFLVFSSIF